MENEAPKKNEIAAPFALYTMRCPEPCWFRAVQGFGLAMTRKEIKGVPIG